MIVILLLVGGLHQRRQEGQKRIHIVDGVRRHDLTNIYRTFFENLAKLVPECRAPPSASGSKSSWWRAEFGTDQTNLTFPPSLPFFAVTIISPAPLLREMWFIRPDTAKKETGGKQKLRAWPANFGTARRDAGNFDA